MTETSSSIEGKISFISDSIADARADLRLITYFIEAKGYPRIQYYGQKIDGLQEGDRIRITIEKNRMSIEQQYQNEIDELKRELELLLRAAYINGAEMASHYFGQEHEPPSLVRIEAEFNKWRTEEPL